MTPTPAAQYEFSNDENGTIGTAGARARVWGVMSIAFGVIQMLTGLLLLPKGGMMPIAHFVGGPISLAVGFTILGVAAAFRQVVDTKGNDVQHMMAALKKLTTAYTIQIVVTVVAFTIGFVAGALGYR